MTHNPNHVRVNREGEYEGILVDEHKAMKHKAQREEALYSISYEAVSMEEFDALVKAGLVKPNSTDKRSVKEIIISRKAKLRHNGEKKSCDSTWVEEAPEEAEPVAENNDDCKIVQRGRIIKVYENGELVAEAIDPTYVSRKEKKLKDLEVCADLDEQYAKWAEENATPSDTGFRYYDWVSETLDR